MRVTLKQQLHGASIATIEILREHTSNSAADIKRNVRVLAKIRNFLKCTRSYITKDGNHFQLVLE